MIGKGLITIRKGSPTTLDISIKEKILSKTAKTIGMTGILHAGIIYIVDGVDRLIALNSISYAEIKKNNLDIDIVVSQHCNVPMDELIG